MQRLVLRAVPRVLAATTTRYACIAAAAPRVRARFYSDSSSSSSGVVPPGSSGNPPAGTNQDGQQLSAAREQEEDGVETAEHENENGNEEDEEDMLDGLSDSLREAIETGDPSKLSEEDKALLNAYIEGGIDEDASRALEGYEFEGEENEEEVLLEDLPDHLRQALETGDFSELSQEEAAALSRILAEEESLPPEILAKLPPQLRTNIRIGAELSPGDMKFIQNLLEEGGYKLESKNDLVDALNPSPAQTLDEITPKRVPVHWAKALQTGDYSAIPEAELPQFESTRALLYAKVQRDSGVTNEEIVDPDDTLAIPQEVIHALETGDTKRVTTADLERVARAADKLQAPKPPSQLAPIDNLMNDPTGAVMDPRGGAERTTGRQEGPDDIFTTKEIKYLAERKRLEAIDRATRDRPRWLGPPEQIPRTYNIPVAVVHFRSHELPLIELYIHFVTHTASALGIPCSKPAFLPRQRSLWTVLKSPFIYKKIQQNFHRITYKRAIKMWDADAEIVTFFIDYITRHTLPGVGVRIVRWDRAPVDVGQQIWLNAVKHPKSTAEILADMTKRVRKAEFHAFNRLQDGVQDLSLEKKKQKKKILDMQAQARVDKAERTRTWERLMAEAAIRAQDEAEARALAEAEAEAEAQAQALLNPEAQQGETDASAQEDAPAPTDALEQTDDSAEAGTEAKSRTVDKGS